MINEQQLIARLKELSTKTAVEGLQRPVQKDSFEYGTLAGKVQGLLMAEELITKLLSEEEDNGGTKRIKKRNAYE
jgi:hypothetical protein